MLINQGLLVRAKPRFILTTGTKATWIVWYLEPRFSRCILPITQSLSVAHEICAAC